MEGPLYLPHGKLQRSMIAFTCTRLGPETRLAECLLKLDLGWDLDGCGLIVYYDKKNWVWAGLIKANDKTLKATADRVDVRFDLGFHGEA
mmetsp:Transcript_30692/g.117453  ORF Transcript_30692/g.117453 Transcript_30692/m.117453 type:complete len:90 (+) Transcript_30692:297-566(+)